MTDQPNARRRGVIRFIHISDTHIHHDPTYILPEASHTPIESAKALVDTINSVPFEPDFVLHTGDVAYDPDPKAYDTALHILSKIRFPVYYLAGNHDEPEALQRGMQISSTVVSLPFRYQLEVNGVQIIAVDSNGPAPQPAGNVTPDQLEWLERLCSDPDDTRPLVVTTHHNVLPTGTPWWDNFMRMNNGEEFHRALLPARHRIRGVFHGHVHQGATTFRDGILYSSVVSSWYQLLCYPGQTIIEGDYANPPGYDVVTVTPEQTFIRRHHFEVGGSRR